MVTGPLKSFPMDYHLVYSIGHHVDGPGISTRCVQDPKKQRWGKEAVKKGRAKGGRTSQDRRRRGKTERRRSSVRIAKQKKKDCKKKEKQSEPR